MRITSKTWNNYISILKGINDKAVRELETWIKIYGTDKGITDLSEIVDLDGNSLIDAAYIITQKYGNASAAISAEMYQALADLSGVPIDAPILAENASYGEVAKTVQGVYKTSQNAGEISSAVSRLVKRTGSDTTLINAKRDGAQFAWVPVGDTCAFCITLASRGWQYMSKNAMKNGHAEHIHSNCDCNYAVRFDDKTTVAGYDPDKYYEQYKDAEGNTPEEKINSMRRKYYAENRETILAEKADRYAERVQLNSSEAEETKVN